MENIPVSTSILFILTTGSTFVFLLSAIRKTGASSWIVPALGIFWLGLQAGLSLNGFYYSDPNSLPPHFPLLIIPPFFLIASLFLNQSGRDFIDKLPLKTLTWIHVVRIPVELVLFSLFLHLAIPELMTFEGRNPDILSGITAPFVVWFGLKQKTISRNGLLLWNFLALCLLINIVVNAILSAPIVFQQQAFDQPNIAVLYFPYCWLPSFIVPVVFFSHLVSIRQIWMAK